MPQDFWDDRNAHLIPLPDHILFDVARNDAADRSYRRHAVEILVNRKSPRVKHRDLADLVAELEIELDGIEFEYGKPSGSGPLVASVTTETMQQEDFPQPEKEDDARQDDSLLRSEARADNAQQIGDVPGEQKPAARRNRNKASAPAS